MLNLIMYIFYSFRGVIMVFTRTWSEELVAEWLIASGYAVLVEVPVGTGKGGGRKEADVIGFKSEKTGIKIVHFEISHIWESAKKVENSIDNKFSSDRVERISQYVASITGSSNIIYEKHAIVFTSRGVLEEVKENLEGKGIKVWSFQEFFNEKVLPIVREKAREGRTFPDSLWLLNMLRTLCSEKLLSGCT